MSHVQKRSKGSYRLIVDLGYDAQGNRIRRTKTVKTSRKTDAEEELAKFIVEVKSGAYVAPEKLKFEDFIKRWDDHFVSKLEVTTQFNYRYQVNRRILPYFKAMYMDQVTTLHILEFMKHLEKPDKKGKIPGPATLVFLYRILRSIFSKAVIWNVISVNPMIGVEKPKENEPSLAYYDESEITALFTALEDKPTHLRVLITLAVTTGMRRGEMAGLEWKHINFDAKTAHIVITIPKFDKGEPIMKPPKNGKTRKIALSDSVLTELRIFYEERQVEKKKCAALKKDLWRDGAFDFLFCHLNGKPYDPQRLTKRWIEFHRAHGLKPIRLHDLRHTSVSWMIFKNVHAKAIAQRIGHKNIKTTMSVYAHVFDSVDQATAAVFDDITQPKKAVPVVPDWCPNSQNGAQSDPIVQ